MLQTTLDGRAEIRRTSTLNERVESSNASFRLPGAEAIKLNVSTGFGTTVTVVDEIFIRRGAETWSVFLSRPLRWEFTEEAARRILASFSFVSEPTGTDPVPTPPRAPATAREFYNRALERFNRNETKLAEADLNEAVRLDPNMADAYLLFARVFCSQKLIISAIRMEDKAISLGGKVQKWCGRDRPPMQ
jgi:tetratricopeptide (TPR) repeat protein